jgi:hypothetical protein
MQVRQLHSARQATHPTVDIDNATAINNQESATTNRGANYLASYAPSA